VAVHVTRCIEDAKHDVAGKSRYRSEEEPRDRDQRKNEGQPTAAPKDTNTKAISDEALANDSNDADDRSPYDAGESNWNRAAGREEKGSTAMGPVDRKQSSRGNESGEKAETGNANDAARGAIARREQHQTENRMKEKKVGARDDRADPQNATQTRCDAHALTRNKISCGEPSAAGGADRTPDGRHPRANRKLARRQLHRLVRPNTNVR
jgi:hypothetical protein